MPQIVNDGTNLALVFDHETFALAGIAELNDTYVFLTRDGRVFEIVMEHLPLAGQTVTASIFDVLATMTPNGEAQKPAPFVPVVFAAASTPNTEPPAEPEGEVKDPAPEEQPAAQEPEPEETPPVEEPAQPEAPAEEPQPEETPVEEPQPDADPVEAAPESEPEPAKDRIKDRVNRGEQVSLMDMIEEINADKAAGRTPDHEKKATGKKGKHKRQAAASA